MRKLLFLACLGLFLGAALEQPVLAADPPLWKVVGDKANKEWGAVRINTATGQTWREDDGHWIPVDETGTAPTAGDPGTYDCVIYFPNDLDSYYALRWNSHNGQSWVMQAGKWADIVVNDK